MRFAEKPTKGLLPVLIVNVSFLIALPLIRVIARHIGLWRRSEADRVARNVLLFLLVFNVLLVYTVSGTIFFNLDFFLDSSLTQVPLLCLLVLRSLSVVPVFASPDSLKLGRRLVSADDPAAGVLLCLLRHDERLARLLAAATASALLHRVALSAVRLGIVASREARGG